MPRLYYGTIEANLCETVGLCDQLASSQVLRLQCLLTFACAWQALVDRQLQHRLETNRLLTYRLM